MLLGRYKSDALPLRHAEGSYSYLPSGLNQRASDRDVAFDWGQVTGDTWPGVYLQRG